MPAQIGYFDTLKSVAGKVFTYLASITLTGTDGKTITCTQNTTLDQDLATTANVAHASIKLSGAEQLKIWTYTHVVTAGEDAANSLNITITAITKSKVRLMMALCCEAAEGQILAFGPAYVTRIYTSSTTNVVVDFDIGVIAGNIISLTIIEAV